MKNNYFWSKLYNLDNLSFSELMSLAINFLECKANIFLHYNEHFAERFPEIAPKFNKNYNLILQDRDKLLNYYRNNISPELEQVVLQKPWSIFAKLLPNFMGIKQQSIKSSYDLAKLEHKLNLFEDINIEFYQNILQKITNIDARNLLQELISHSRESKADFVELFKDQQSQQIAQQEKNKNRLLTLIQPGIAGLMDGSVSTLGPIFAAAFATNSPRQTFLVGLSASIGAGISMGFTEAIHDDGKLTGRGSPIKRGLANGIMTAIGGMGHTLPYLINNFKLATIIAIIAVFLELGAIVWVQNKYMKTPLVQAAIQVVLGGILVFIAGIIIGTA